MLDLMKHLTYAKSLIFYFRIAEPPDEFTDETVSIEEDFSVYWFRLVLVYRDIYIIQYRDSYRQIKILHWKERLNFTDCIKNF